MTIFYYFIYSFLQRATRFSFSGVVVEGGIFFGLRQRRFVQNRGAEKALLHNSWYAFSDRSHQMP